MRAFLLFIISGQLHTFPIKSTYFNLACWITLTKLLQFKEYIYINMMLCLLPTCPLNWSNLYPPLYMNMMLCLLPTCLLNWSNLYPPLYIYIWCCVFYPPVTWTTLTSLFVKLRNNLSPFSLRILNANLK